MTEVWKPILDGSYEVSDLGNVRRAKPGRRTSIGRLMKPVVLNTGYLSVAPVVDGKNVQMLVHRLVAEAFLGLCPEGMVVNHKDGNKANPALSNLEYVTHAENMAHAARTGLMARGEDHPNAKLTNDQVGEMRVAAARGETNGSLARRFGVSPGTVTGIVSEQKRKPLVKVLDQTVTKDFALYQGDCVEVVKALPRDSIHYSVFSPPFQSLFCYSASDRDLGNVRDGEEFFEHFSFLVGDLLRVTIPGRLLSMHCMLLPTSKARDGYIGLTDFRGDLIRAFTAAGWIFHSEVCIWKDPVTAMQRTKALGLLHKQLKKDSCMSRQGVADYLVTMRKPGVNPEPVEHTNESFPVKVWQRYASPVWMDIDPNDTLQYRSARENDDERHICPLQLPVIRRALELWTNPGDRVLSPFAGIGSEGVVALEMGRRFVGVELKRSYYEQASRNLAGALAQTSLFGSTT